MANKRKISAAVLLSLLAACAFAQTATTAPVGFTKFEFPTGRKAVGVNLLNPAVVSGVVASNTGTVVALADSTANIGSLLDPNASYYFEVVGGPDSTYVGDWVDVDEASTVAVANNTIVVAVASAGNTFGGTLGADAIAGYRVVLRKHVTIGQVFGTKGNTPMQGGSSLLSADQILFYASGGFETYYLLRDPTGSIEQWVKVGEGVRSQDNKEIYPGTGVIVNRVGSTTAEVVLTGGVRLNRLAKPLASGYNLVASGFPVDQSPSRRLMTVSNGFAGSTSLLNSDRILTLEAGGSFNTYYLLYYPSRGIEQWSLVGSGSSSFNDTDIFNWDGAAFIYKTTADQNHILPVTF